MSLPVKTRAERRAVRRAGEGGKRVEYLAFVLAQEKYAVRIAHVAEILRTPPITEVPRAPSNVLGVVSVRGKLVTVVDLRRRLQLAEAPMTRRSRVLLGDLGTGEQMGMLVDEVLQVWRLSAEEIEPSNVLGAEQPVHIAGIARPSEAPDELLVLLDLRPIIESP